MKKSSKLFVIISLILMLPLVYTFGCKSNIDKIEAGFSQTEFSIDLDEDTSSHVFDIKVSNLSKDMTSNVEFNYEKSGIVSIDTTPIKTSSDGVNTYSFTVISGGQTNVNVIHRDTNKNLGTLKFNVIKKLESISLKQNVTPYAVVNETTPIDLSNFNLTPIDTTQTNIKFRINDNNSIAEIKQDNSILVTGMPSNGKISITAYSEENVNATSCTFELTVVERPNVNNFTLFDYNDNSKVYYSNGNKQEITLIKDYPSRNSVDFSYSYVGQDVKLEFLSNNDKLIDIDSLGDYYNVFAKNVGASSIRCKISVQNFDNVYSIVDVPVKVVRIPKAVSVNNIQEDQDLTIYSSYTNQSGYKLTLNVDEIDSLNNGRYEIGLELDKPNLFTLYYADGVTEIDLASAVLKNGEVVYLVANENQLTGNDDTGVLKVYSKRAKDVGEDVSVSLNLTGSIGTTSIAVDYGNREDLTDKTIYVEVGQTAVINYKLNRGAVIKSLDITKTSNDYATITSNIQDSTITINPLNVGQFNIQLKTDNGTTSELIPVYVYRALDTNGSWQVRFEDDDFVTNIVYDYGELKSFALMTGHGTTLSYYIPTGATIYSSEIENLSGTNLCMISSPTNYIFASKTGNTKIRISITTLQSQIANGLGNGNAIKQVHYSNEISLDTYRAITNIALKDSNGFTISYDTSLYMNNENLDKDFYDLNKHILEITPMVTPSNANYESISWASSENFLKIAYTEDANGEYVLIDGDNFIYEKYDELVHLGQTRYTDRKVRIIANPSGDGYSSQSTYTAYVSCTITQFGKNYVKNFLVYARNEISPKFISVDQENIYEKYQDGQEINLNVVVDSNADNREFSLEYDQNLFDIVVVNSQVKIKPKKACASQIKINANGTKDKNGNFDSKITKTINIVIADGLTKDTAYQISTEKDFKEMLKDNQFHYYQLIKDIDLSSNVTSSNEFKGHLFALDGTTYDVRNITIDGGKSLFNVMTGAMIENINFYFNDVTVSASDDLSYACLVNELNDNSRLRDVYVYCNNINVNVSKADIDLFVGGVVSKSNNSYLEDVSFEGNIRLLVSNENSLNMKNLYVGLLVSNMIGGNISGQNVNYSNNTTIVSVVGSIVVSNKITSTSSFVGGVVGNLQANISNIDSDVNVLANSLDNVGSVAGYVENATLTHILSRGMSQGKNNVGGLVGQLKNSTIGYSIYEMNFNKTRGELNNLNLIYYVLGSQNVGGLVGTIVDGTSLSISNTYVKSYQSYLIIKGLSNIGGLVGNLNTNLEISKTYASVNMITDNESQMAGFIGYIKDDTKLNIENAFYKGNISIIEDNVISSVSNAKPYASKVTSVSKSYAVVNDNGYYLNENVSSKVDLLTKNTFDSNDFNITNDSGELSNKDWFISTDKNDGNPILVINGKIADNDVSKQELENALSNLDNLKIDSSYGTDKLSTGERYLILTNGKYNLVKKSDNLNNYLFDFNGLAIGVKIVSSNNNASINGNELHINREGEVKLRVYAINNEDVYVDIYIVSINEVTFNSITINVLKDKTIDTSIDLGSNLVKLGINHSEINTNYVISNGEEVGSNYIFTTNKISVEGLKVSNSEINMFAFVQINGEYVKLDSTSTNSTTLTINVTDKANNITVSATEISLSPMDEFDFNVTIDNAQTDEQVEIVVTDNNGNELTDLTKNGIGIDIPKFSKDINSNDYNNAFVQLIYGNTSKDASILTQNYKLKINPKYLDPEKIIDFDDFDIKLTFNPKSNKDLTKQLVIHITKQDVLKMTMEYFSNGQTKIQNNVEVFEPNEITTNTIIPGKTGILAINMFPTYSNFDGVYITAIGENGQEVYLDQKVLVQYDTGTTTSTKEFVSVRPNLTPVENGIYLRKVSKAELGSTLVVNETNLKYDGNIYVMAYISANTPKNVKFTFKVHTYRTDINGNIIANSVIESREFYLYSEEVPTISIDTDLLDSPIHLENDSVDYYPLVKGQTQRLTYKFINFEQINENDVAISGDVITNKGIGYVDVNISDTATVGNKCTVYFSISKTVNGVDIESIYQIHFIAVDYIIEDFYLAKENYTTGESTTSNSKAYIKDSANNVKSIIYPENNSILENIPATLSTEIYPILKIRGTISQDDYNKYVAEIYEKLINDYLKYNNGYSSNDFSISVENSKLYIKTNLIQSYDNALKLQLFWKYEFNSISNTQSVVLGNSSSNGIQKTIERIFTIDSTDSSSIESAYPIYDKETFLRAMTETGHWILMVDIDLTDDYNETSFTGFTPNFLSLNGNNHSVKVPMIAKSAESGEDNVGFFKTLSSGQIVKNLKINYNLNAYENKEDETENVVKTVNEFDVSGLTTLNFGLFVGTNSGSIYNCYVAINNDAEYESEASYKANINFINTENVTLNIGGFAGSNETDSYISNSYVNYNGKFVVHKETDKREYELNAFYIGLSLNADTTSNIAGFVASNKGKLSKNAVYNIEINSQDDESKVSGFVVNNQGSINESLVDNKILGEQINAKYKDSLNLSTKGIVSGFVYTNNGTIKNSYSNVTLKTPYRSAGFVYINNNTIEECFTSSKNVTGETSRANSLFTGTNELNEINNTGLIKNSYYELNAEFVNEYKDIMFDEPASNVYTKEINIATSYYGFDFGVDPEKEGYKFNNYSTWVIKNGRPTLRFNNEENRITYYVDIAQSQGAGQVKTYDQNNGACVENPYVVYNANSLLSVLNDATSAGNTNVTKYIQLSNDIDMQEVENDARFKNVQQITLIGGIDGNSFTINNLSVLITSQDLKAKESFGFFSQIGNSGNTFTTIKNLDIDVKEMDSSTAVRVGLIAGKTVNSQFVNVQLSGEEIVVSGANMVGALVGQAVVEDDKDVIYLFDISSNLSVSAGYDSKTANKTYNTYVDAKNKKVYNEISYAGGLIGVLDNNIITKFNALILKTYGKLTITGDYAGGLFGYAKGCIYDAKFEVVEEENAQHINGRYSAGGIVGELEESSKLYYAKVEVEDSIVNSYDNKDEDKKVETLFIDETIEGLTPEYIGGLVGYDKGSRISFAYSKANVINYNATYVGGLIGYAGNNISFTEVYVTGNVSGKTAGGLIGKFDNEIVSGPDLNFYGVITINNFAESKLYANAKKEADKNKTVMPSQNVYAFVGEAKEIINLNVKDGETLLNYIYVKDGVNLRKIEAGHTFTDRKTMKESYTTTFNIGVNFSAEHWKSINEEENYYPSFAYVTPTNIIYVYNAKQLNKLSSTDLTDKTIYIMNDIDLSTSDRFIGNITLNASTFISKIDENKEPGKTAHTISGIKLSGENHTFFSEIRNESQIKNVNFVFDDVNVTVTSQTYGVLVGYVYSGLVSDCNVVFNTDNVNLIVQQSSTVGLILGQVSKNENTATETSVLGVQAITVGVAGGYNNLNFNVKLDNKIDLKLGGFVGASQSSSITKIELLTENRVLNINLSPRENNTKSSNSSITVGGFAGTFTNSTNSESSVVNKINVALNTNLKDVTSLDVGGIVGSIAGGSFVSNIGDIFKVTIVDESTGNNINIGGFASTAGSAKIKNIKLDATNNITSINGNIAGFIVTGTNKVEIENCSVEGNLSSTDGLVAGFVMTLSGNQTKCNVNSVKGNLTSKKASAYGFAQQIEGTVENCGTYGTINASVEAMGFAQTLNDGTIKNSFAYREIQFAENGVENGAGFVNTVNGTISNCYAVGKIVNNNNNGKISSANISAFANTLNSKAKIEYSFTTVAVLDRSLSSVGFARTAEKSNQITNSYYVYNLASSEHNGLGLPVDFTNLNKAFTNQSGSLKKNDGRFMPNISYNNSSLEATLFGEQIFEQSGAMNFTNISNIGSLESNKYYYMSGTVNTTNASINDNVILVGFNTTLNKINSIGENSLVTGAKVTDSAFVKENSGFIFNCHTSGNINSGDDNTLYGFAYVNSGAISHSSVNSVFTLGSNNNVAGFVYENAGSIRNCNAITDIKADLYDENYDIKDATGKSFSGFVATNDANASKIEDCYTVYSSTISTNAYAFYKSNQANSISNCFTEDKANILSSQENVSKIDLRAEYENANKDAQSNSPLNSKIYGRNDTVNYGYPYLVNYQNNNIADLSNTQGATSSKTIITKQHLDNAPDFKTGINIYVESNDVYIINNPSDWTYYLTNSKNSQRNFAVQNNININLLSNNSTYKAKILYGGKEVNKNTNKQIYKLFGKTDKSISFTFNVNDVVCLDISATISLVNSKFDTINGVNFLLKDIDISGLSKNAISILQDSEIWIQSNSKLALNADILENVVIVGKLGRDSYVEGHISQYRNSCLGQLVLNADIDEGISDDEIYKSDKRKEFDIFGLCDVTVKGKIGTMSNCVIKKCTLDSASSLGTFTDCLFNGSTFYEPINTAIDCTFKGDNTLSGNRTINSSTSGYYGLMCNKYIATGKNTSYEINQIYTDNQIQITNYSATAVGGIFGYVELQNNSGIAFSECDIKLNVIQSNQSYTDIGGFIGKVSGTYKSNHSVEWSSTANSVMLKINSNINGGSFSTGLFMGTAQSTTISVGEITGTNTKNVLNIESINEEQYYAGSIVGTMQDSDLNGNSNKWITTKIKAPLCFKPDGAITVDPDSESHCYVGGIIGRSIGNTDSVGKNVINNAYVNVSITNTSTFNNGLLRNLYYGGLAGFSDGTILDNSNIKVNVEEIKKFIKITYMTLNTSGKNESYSFYWLEENKNNCNQYTLLGSVFGVMYNSEMTENVYAMQIGFVGINKDTSFIKMAGQLGVKRNNTSQGSHLENNGNKFNNVCASLEIYHTTQGKLTFSNGSSTYGVNDKTRVIGLLRAALVASMNQAGINCTINQSNSSPYIWKIECIEELKNAGYYEEIGNSETGQGRYYYSDQNHSF